MEKDKSTGIKRFLLVSLAIAAGSFVVHSVWSKSKQESEQKRKESMIPRIILWTIPRSVSTAFERAIMEVPKGKIFHERFGAAYYFGPDKITEYECDVREKYENTTYDDIIKMYCDSSYDQNYDFVFIKEFAYYITQRNGKFGKNGIEYYKSLLENEFKYPKFFHTFLIRNPKKQVLSLYKVSEKIENYEFTEDEIGFKELHQIYDHCNDLGFKNMAIIDSGDLLNDPKTIMKKYCETVGLKYNDNVIDWKDSKLWTDEQLKEHFEIWDHGWHDNALESTGLVKNPNGGKIKAPKDVDKDIERLPNNVKEMIHKTMPLYDQLYARRLH